MERGGSNREFPEHSFVYSYEGQGQGTDCQSNSAVPIVSNIYPSIPVASVPPISEQGEREVLLQPPMYQQQPRPYNPYQPNQAQAAPPSSYYVPPPPAYRPHHNLERVEDPPGCIHVTLQLALYHLVNFVLGVTAFCVVITGASLTVSLLPLCCFGLVIYRLLVPVVGLLAQLDVRLHNYVSIPADRILIDLPRDNSRIASAGHVTLSGYRLAPKIAEISPLSLMATLYFLTLKFALGIASCVVLALFVLTPTVLVVGANGGDVQINFGDDPDDAFTPQDDPLAFAVAAICLFIISMALLHVLARISCWATRFFCAEKFTLTHYYFSSSSDLGATGVYVNSAASYGSTGY